MGRLTTLAVGIAMTIAASAMVSATPTLSPASPSIVRAPDNPSGTGAPPAQQGGITNALWFERPDARP